MMSPYGVVVPTRLVSRAATLHLPTLPTPATHIFTNTLFTNKSPQHHLRCLSSLCQLHSQLSRFRQQFSTSSTVPISFSQQLNFKGMPRDNYRGRGSGRRDGDSHRGGTADVVFSKSLSFILRHGAIKEGLPIRSDGYANVADLVRTFTSILLQSAGGGNRER